MGGAATPELQVIEDTAEAMGSLRALSGTATLVTEGQGRVWRLGQNKGPRSDLPYYEIGNYRLQIDFANDRWRLSQERTSTFLTGNPLYGARQTYGLDGDVAYDEQGERTVRASARVATDRRAEMYHNPIGILLLALDETSTVSNLREEAGQQVIDIAAADGTQFTLFVDGETGLPSKVISSTYHPNLGDVAVETRFEDYAETGGLGGFGARLTLPRVYTTNLDRFQVSTYRVATTPDAQIDDLAAPADVRSTAPAMASATLEVEEVASGVWYLTGQSHHSVLVEFDEYLALIEAPQSEQRTLAVIEHARELQPDKPLQYVVNTHHHFDHSAGIRAAVSEGLTVITHQVNRSFFEDMVARQHSIEPDALARNPQPLTMEDRGRGRDIRADRRSPNAADLPDLGRPAQRWNGDGVSAARTNLDRGRRVLADLGGRAVRRGAAAEHRGPGASGRYDSSGSRRSDRARGSRARSADRAGADRLARVSKQGSTAGWLRRLLQDAGDAGVGGPAASCWGSAVVPLAS